MHEVDVIAIRKAMAEVGFNNIEQLSVASGINRNTTAKVLNGKTYPSSRVMEAFKVALHLSSEQAGAIFFKEKVSSNANK